MSNRLKHTSKYLMETALAVALQLKRQSKGTQIKVRKPTKFEKIETGGWWVKVGSLGKEQPSLEIWLDKFTGHESRKLYACFYCEDGNQITKISKMYSKNSTPPLQLSDDDVIEVSKELSIMKLPLLVKNFNQPIVEHYKNDGSHHFFGIYDPTDVHESRVNMLFVERAVAFFIQVARSLPQTTKFDPDLDTYPRAENRKLVKAHLEHERSTYNAVQCKIRDGFHCRVCDMKFSDKYGCELGSDYAEAHHKVSLKNLGDNVLTSIEDLITVCANCHRMLHRMEGNANDFENLRDIISENKKLIRKVKAI